MTRHSNPKNLTTQRLTRWLLAAALVAVPMAARAQLSLGSAVDLALNNDPRVRSAQADIDRARAALSEAHDAYVPVVNISGGYGKSVGPPAGLPTVFSIASQSLVFNFSQMDNVRSAAASLESAKLALKEAEQQVIEDVTVSYITLDNDRKKRAALTDEGDAANRLVSIVSDRLNAGLDTQIDLLRSKRTAAQIHLLSLQEDHEIDTQNEHLTRLLGMQGVTLQTVASSIPALPQPGTFTAQKNGDSFGVRAAFADARGKQELAFGAARYLYRPQISLVTEFSRLNTSPSQSNFLDYYPNFSGKSNNLAAIALQIEIPLLDRAHSAHARQVAAEASHTWFQAEIQRNQFLEGRSKLRRSVEELSVRAEIAGYDTQISQQQLSAIQLQLNATNGTAGGTQLTPKDEQNALIDEQQKTIDLLSAQMELDQAEINLMRQQGTLSGWISQATAPPSLPSAPAPILKQP